MNASLFVLALALGADEPQRSAVSHSGLSGLVATTTAASPISTPQADHTVTTLARRRTTDRRQNDRLSGGGPDASQLIGLIQTTIAPDTWQAPVGAAGVGGLGNAVGAGGTSPRIQLVELIQDSIEPESWDINGGPGSISVFAQ